VIDNMQLAMGNMQHAILEWVSEGHMQLAIDNFGMGGKSKYAIGNRQ
jgi:hypothetical protein